MAGGKEKELFIPCSHVAPFFCLFLFFWIHRKTIPFIILSESESMICTFMLDPALLTQNTCMTSCTNSHMRLLMGGGHTLAVLITCIFLASSVWIREPLQNGSPTRTVKYFQKHCNSKQWYQVQRYEVKTKLSQEVLITSPFICEVSEGHRFLPGKGWRQCLLLPWTLHTDPSSLSFSGMGVILIDCRDLRTVSSSRNLYSATKLKYGQLQQCICLVIESTCKFSKAVYFWHGTGITLGTANILVA